MYESYYFTQLLFALSLVWNGRPTTTGTKVYVLIPVVLRSHGIVKYPGMACTTRIVAQFTHN